MRSAPNAGEDVLNSGFRLAFLLVQPLHLLAMNHHPFRGG
jgi:hypothetical protein